MYSAEQRSPTQRFPFGNHEVHALDADSQSKEEKYQEALETVVVWSISQRHVFIFVLFSLRCNLCRPTVKRL